ncbi:MAG: SdrD B-like domain-containing protein [Chloroflexota bacterium]
MKKRKIFSITFLFAFLLLAATLPESASAAPTSQQTVSNNPQSAEAIDSQLEGSLSQTQQSTPKITCDSNGSIFNTGINSSNNRRLSVGQRDPNWKVGAGTNAGPQSVGNWQSAYVIGQRYSSWTTSPFNNAEWIGYNQNGTHTGLKDYYYSYTFELDAQVNIEKFNLDLNFYADNAVIEIYINGVAQSNNLPNIPQSANGYYYRGYIPENAASTSLNSNWQTGTNEIIIHTQTGYPGEGFLAYVQSEAVCNPPLPPLSCDGTPYQVRNNQIFSLDTSTGAPLLSSPLATFPRNINSLGFNPQDNYMYAANGSRIYQIGANGAYRDMGKVPGLGGNYIGDFLADGTYVIGNSNKLWFIDLDKMEIIRTINVNMQSSADIATSPIDGNIYLKGDRNDQLMTINLATGQISNVGPSYDGNSGSLWFDSEGNLYAYSFTTKFYKIDANTGEYEIVGSASKPKGHDAASCPYNVSLLLDIEDSLACGVDLEFDFNILNKSIGTINNANLTQTLPAGFNFRLAADQIEIGLRQVFGNEVAVAINGQTITISNMTLKPGNNSFSVLVDQNGYSATAAQFQATLSGLPTYLGGSIQSDDPQTGASPDPTAVKLADVDQDGVQDCNDIDDDNDGILDTVECGQPAQFKSLYCGLDKDNDGIFNFLDLDSDQDGIPDLVEAGGVDVNNDGLVDNFRDTNGNGYHDAFESSPLPIPNTDGRGETNPYDIDSDDDGIPDNVEAQPTNGYVAPGTQDVDRDGILNYYDVDQLGATLSSPEDTDNDGIPDYIDNDSDNDFIFDIAENSYAADQISGQDADGDGLDDAFEGQFKNDPYDVNDEIDVPKNDLPDEDGLGDVDYRDKVSLPSIKGSVWSDNDSNGLDDSDEPAISSVDVRIRPNYGENACRSALADTGLYAEYFGGTYDLSYDTIWLRRKVDPQINFSWSGQFDEGLRSGNFSVRWSGFIIPRYSEMYTFYVTGNSGAQLEINNTLIIDEWGGTGERQAEIFLEAGQPYPINLEMNHRTTPSVAKLEWSSNSQGRQVVPESRLTPIQTTQTDGNGDYAFSDLPPGQYCLRFITPEYFAFTEENVGDDDTIDSDVLEETGTTPPVEIELDLSGTDIDAGMIPPGAIGDLVWADLNKNGLQDPEEPPFAEIPVRVAAVNSLGACPTQFDSGLFHEYYNNWRLTGDPLRTSIEPNVDMPFQTRDGGIQDGHRWTGYIKPKYNEEYTFYGFFDDGVRLWVDDKLLMDDWYWWSTTERVGKIELEADRWYSIRIEQNNRGRGPSAARLSWSSASQPKQVIPRSAFTTAVYEEQITDANGRYLFNNLPRSEYCVSLSVPETWTVTVKDAGADNIDSDFNTTPSQFGPVTVSGNYYDNIDGGLMREPLNVCQPIDLRKVAWNVYGVGSMTYDIESDTVTYSTNGIGADNGAELLFSEISFVPDTSDFWKRYGLRLTVNNIISTGRTGDLYLSGASGLEAIGLDDYLNKGSRIVDINAAAADRFVFKASNGSAGSTYSVTFSQLELCGEDEEPLELGTAAGFAWNDLSQDGIRQDSEAGLPNIQVELYNRHGDLIDAALTDDAGNYAFNDITPSQSGQGYYIKFYREGRYVFSPKDSGSSRVDSDVDPITGETDPFGMDAGQSNSFISAGMFEADLDHGDAPSSYGDSYTAAGLLYETLWLGVQSEVPDTESYDSQSASSGQVSSPAPLTAPSNNLPVLGSVSQQTIVENADADDKNGIDDEEGLIFPSEDLSNGIVFYLNRTYTIDSKVYNPTFDSAYLNGWVDFNGNGEFDTDELVINRQVGSSPSVQLLSDDVTVPLDSVCGTTFARFRLSDLVVNNPYGYAGFGETEDYAIFIDCKTDLEVYFDVHPDPSVQLSDEVTIESFVKSNGPNPSRDLVFEFTYPADLENVETQSHNGWDCTYGAGTATCSKATFEADADEKVLTISGRVPGTFQPNEVSGHGTVTHENPDPAPTNSTLVPYSIDVDKGWQSAEGVQNIKDIFLYTKHSEVLNALESERDFLPDEILANPINIPLDFAAGLTVSKQPTLTTPFCLDNHGTEGCDNDTDIIVGSVLVKSYVIESIKEQQLSGNNYVDAVGASNILPNVQTILLYPSGAGRYALDDPALCSDWSSDLGGFCMARYDLWSQWGSPGTGGYADLYAWSQSELTEVIFESSGGRELACAPGIGHCAKISDAKPGIYLIEGKVSFEYVFHDSEHLRLGTPVLRFEDELNFNFYIQIVAPFIESE